ncbi:Sorting nexin-16 [Halocaridina rubra]|uniref:Sorting nexin-16 n=1 Tax=Halocaridina rubra TaxID=373956 RepID=A0AAN9A0L4_HALRR
MALSRVAVTRGMAASREVTPSNSRSASRRTSRETSPINSMPSSAYASREVLNTGNIASSSHPLDNHPELIGNTLMNGNPNPNRLSAGRGGRSTSGNAWYGSSSNLTSTDSTPSSENTNDSGAGTETSPLSGPLAALGFSQTNGNNNTCLYRMPIVGYEVLEERSRFTIFKIQVFHQPSGDQWFVFRRFTDFVRLNKKLQKEFPGLRFALPPKRWFGDNFDPIFLEDRQIGLQAFIDNIIGHTKIREKKCVRDFFCLDDPPGAHDTLEESRAMCQSLEENVADLQEQLRERESEIAILKSQVSFLMAQQQTLVKALRLECELQGNENYTPGSTHDLNIALLSM